MKIRWVPLTVLIKMVNSIWIYFCCTLIVVFRYINETLPSKGWLSIYVQTSTLKPSLVSVIINCISCDEIIASGQVLSNGNSYYSCNQCIVIAISHTYCPLSYMSSYQLAKHRAPYVCVDGLTTFYDKIYRNTFETVDILCDPIKSKYRLVKHGLRIAACIYLQPSSISRIIVGDKTRCSCIITCRRYSNYIFIRDLTHSSNGLGKHNCKTRHETFRFCDLLQLMLEA